MTHSREPGTRTPMPSNGNAHIPDNRQRRPPKKKRVASAASSESDSPSALATNSRTSSAMR